MSGAPVCFRIAPSARPILVSGVGLLLGHAWKLISRVAGLGSLGTYVMVLSTRWHLL